MKKLATTFLTVFISIFSFAQVGIGLDTPSKELDINGELRIRNVNTGQHDQVLIVDESGVVYKRSLSQLISEALSTIRVPTVAAVIQYDNIQPYEILVISDNIYPIPFNHEVVINHNLIKYDMADNSFTVLEDGIYQFILQTGFKKSSTENEIVLGIAEITTSGSKKYRWIGRATWTQHLLQSGTFPSYADRTFNAYSSTLKLKKGDKLIAGVSSLNGRLLHLEGTQTGDTGNGNVTNLSIVKY